MQETVPGGVQAPSVYFMLTSGEMYESSLIINPQHACAVRVTVVVLCVCLSTGANLWTGTSRRLTEGTSGFSGTFFTRHFL